MSGKVVVTGVLLLFFTGLIVFMVEFFYPLSAGSEFNTECRAALLKMEVSGGMTQSIRDELLSGLQSLNFTSVSIAGTESQGIGRKLVLSVDADYSYSGITGFFERTMKIRHLKYEKTMISRMVDK